MESSVHIPEPEPEVTLKFKSRSEASELLRELQTWSPSGGWSPVAGELFEALEEAAMKGSM